MQKSFLTHLVLKAWILSLFFLFFPVSKQVPCFTAIEGDGDLLAKLMMLHHQILFSLDIAEATLKQTSAEQVPGLLSDT